MKNRFVLSVKLGSRVCYLRVLWSSALIRHQGNFVGPLVSYTLLFAAYCFDFRRLEHLEIQFLFVSLWIRNLIEGYFLLKSFMKSSNSCSEPVHIINNNKLKNIFVLSLLYREIYFNSKFAMKRFAQAGTQIVFIVHPFAQWSHVHCF